MTRATEAVRFPFGQPAALQAPPEFAVLRAERPVQRVQMPFGGEGWLVTRYADSKFVWSDPRFSRAATVNADIPRSSPQLNPPGHLSAMDPPEHSRLRRLVGGAFTVKAAQRWRSRTEQIAGDLITGLLAKGAPVDLVDNFSLPLPITVICELLGVPKEDRRLFERVSQAVPGTSAVTDEQAQAACDELICYLAQHISARRDQPDGARPDDLLTTLIQARDRGDRLSEAELINMGCVIIIGGHETTAGSISNFVYTLVETGQWAQLARHPEKLNVAIEELLRYVQLHNTGGLARIATEDVEIAGQLVRKGDAVIVDLNSANRDASIFQDAETLDLEREHNPHVAFAYGAHRCPGAQLARMELQVGIGALLRQLPGLRLAGSAEDIPWRAGTAVDGPRELLLSW